MALGKRNDLNIANNQKSQNLKNSKPIRTFWKRSNWNRNEIRNGNDLLRTFRNCLVKWQVTVLTLFQLIIVETFCSPVHFLYSYLQHFILFYFIFGSELLLVAKQFRKVLNKSLSFLILFLFQLLLLQKVLIGFEFFKFCDFWFFAIFKTFSQCHGRWYWKTILPIRDVQLLCQLSIQSSRWIWFNESRSVGHFLFIIQHQIIFIIFYSLRYLHLIFYLFSIYF